MSTSALSISTSQSSSTLDPLSLRRKMVEESSKSKEQSNTNASSNTFTAAPTAATPHSGSLNAKSLSASSALSMTQMQSTSTREVLASRQAGQPQAATTRLASGEKAYMQAIKAAQVPTSSSQPMGGSPAGPSVKALKANAPSTNEKYSAGDAKKAPAEAQLYKPSARAGNKTLVAKSLGTGAM